MKSLMKKIAGIAAVLTVIVISAPSASAAGTADFTPNPVPVSPGETTVSLNVTWDFGTANTSVPIDICKKPTSDPTFNLTEDCDRGGLKTFNGSPDGSGSANTTLAVGPTFGWQLFGQNLDKWGCYPDDPGFPVDEGFQSPDTCYVRVTQTDRFNNDDAIDILIEWAVGGTEIPEAPLVVLPVLIGALGVGGFLYLSRRSGVA